MSVDSFYEKLIAPKCRVRKKTVLALLGFRYLTLGNFPTRGRHAGRSGDILTVPSEIVFALSEAENTLRKLRKPRRKAAKTTTTTTTTRKESHTYEQDRTK